jgi:excisionase family DNA binding protein
MATRISLRDAAKMLDLSESTVRRLADAGRLGAVVKTPGGFRRLSREGVEKFKNGEPAPLPFQLGGL